MSTPTVGLVGSGPATDAVRAALEDAPTEFVACDPERVGAADFAVVTGSVESSDETKAADETKRTDETSADVFARANTSAREGTTPWLAVEFGGVAGQPIPGVEAAVSGFAPATACWKCLRTRVGANLDDEAKSNGPALDPASARFAGALAGREAARLLSGGESAVLGGILEVPHAERAVLPVPGCEACGADGPRARTLDREYATTDLEDAIARAEQAVDERVGLVTSVGEVESFPAPYYLSNLADTSGFSDAQAAEQAAGVAADWNEALMKALGEALERYSAGVHHESAFETARASHFDSSGATTASAPDEFVRPEGWPDAAADGEELDWVRGENLQTGDRVHLPAEFVHFPPPETRYKPSITTGLGLGNSTVEALLSGCYEMIERDATMLAWYSTFEPLGLAVENGRFETLRRRARAEDLDVTALLVTQDVDVPVVAVAVHRDDEWPKFAVGSDADLNPDAAATSALAEALQNWMELRSMGPDDASEADGAIGRYADFPEAAREFVAPETTVPSASVGPADPLGDDSGNVGEAELDAVLDRLADADLSAYAARLTPRDVQQLGFEAVRVLAPEAQPLFTDESYFGERAREAPAELGFEFRPDRDHHPYP